MPETYDKVELNIAGNITLIAPWPSLGCLASTHAQRRQWPEALSDNSNALARRRDFLCLKLVVTKVCISLYLRMGLILTLHMLILAPSSSFARSAIETHAGVPRREREELAAQNHARGVSCRMIIYPILFTLVQQKFERGVSVLSGGSI